jgi:putative IMPACT (imprinted ancient) family translation regulator
LAKQIDDREQGMLWLTELKAIYPDARHHCWAYLLGNPSCATNAGMGDDGEPSGTAGKPILNVLQHKGAIHVSIPEAEIKPFIQHLKTLHQVTFQTGDLCPH